MVKFEGKAEEKELGGSGGERVHEAQRNMELESAGRGSVGYAHIRTGVLDVKVSWVLSIIEMPYYILVVTE